MSVIDTSDAMSTSVNPTPSGPDIPTSPHTPIDFPRRHSPWQDLESVLSEAGLPIAAQPLRPQSSPAIVMPEKDETDLDSPGRLSASQAMRRWIDQLSHPQSDVRRHQLNHVLKHPSPQLAPYSSLPTPKLAAEIDKHGHIEYKLKLIDPSPERFEKLVTQMVWRLKQGKNEAMYELGVWDDGTVAGLTRAEMDSSLRTLELMAAEVGATVLIVREVVLTGSSRILDSPSLTADTSLSSSTTSIRSPSSNAMGYINPSWLSRRPDIRKGSHGIKNSMDGSRGFKHDWQRTSGSESSESHQPMCRKKRIIFGPVNLDTDSDDSATTESHGESPTSSPNLSSLDSHDDGGWDEDPMPFRLDEDEPPASHPNTRQSLKPQSVPQIPVIASKPATTSATRVDKKTQKSTARRERRRLELLRGDGTNPLWAEEDKVDSCPFDVEPTPSLPRIPHQPNRPSSLRLATPAILNTDSDSDDYATLLSVPLDSLSLSFAHVEDASESLALNRDFASISHSIHHHADECTTEGEARPPPGYVVGPFGEEMICVEALVVRKVHPQHAGLEQQEQEEEDTWVYGGEEDTWGFGREDDFGSN